MVTVSLVHVDTLARHAYIMACSLYIIRGREYQQCHLYSNTVWYARKFIILCIQFTCMSVKYNIYVLYTSSFEYAYSLIDLVY